MPEESLRLDVNEQIECAHTLASRFYVDPAILEIEKEKIFRRTWQLVGTLSQPCGEMNGAKRTIADAETFFTAEVTGEPIVIVRDKQGTLRASATYAATVRGPSRRAAAARMFCAAAITAGRIRSMGGSLARRMWKAWSSSTAAPWAWCRCGWRPGNSSSSSILI